MSSSSSPRSDRSFDTPAEKLRHEVERLIEAVWAQGEKAIDAVGLGGVDKSWTPAVDVTETQDSVQVLMDLPGVDPQGIEISLVGNMLTIKGARITPILRPEDSRHRRESPTGAFSRSIPLPTAVDPDKVSADSKNGVLTVTLAKEERIKARHIKVETKAPATTPC